MPTKHGKAPVGNRNNKRKQVMGEPSGTARQQQVTIPTTNIFSVQPQQQVQQLPCQFSSALQLNFNNNQPEPEINNLDRFMSRPFTSYTALLTEGLEEQNYAPINIHRQVEQTTKAHIDEVRNMLHNVYRQHFINLKNSAKKEAGKKVKEKQEELREARMRISQLELTVGQLNYMGQISQSGVSTLLRRIALQDAALRARAGGGGSESHEDAESSCVDPNRVEPPPNMGSCRACGNGEATAIIFPCRHLCVCATCSVSAAVDACPVCQSPKENVYEVILP
ncbi:hypothetical protein K7X08_020266 [Anisodus acutangulus]|uniref:RING-type domain-containing protein n=1 Tax=Anisodus acutangulus TaxID=402998 RepID=A0A9Q1M792_9SOLA|nr:hypothetical protein K7X08_020266 [Anisodus acutangulus]